MEISSVDDFATMIAKSLEEYSEEVEAAVEAAVNEVAEDTLSDLKNNPIIPKSTGKYKKGFYLKKTYTGKGTNKDYYKIVVANKEYRIGHLLERGHLTRNGTGRTQAYPHWKQAQAVADKLPEKVKEALT